MAGLLDELGCLDVSACTIQALPCDAANPAPPAVAAPKPDLLALPAER